MMALTIILLLLFGAVVWAALVTHTRAGAQRAAKFDKPRWHGSVRRYSRLGRPVIQTDEQRTEWIQMNRDRYDPSIDLLDPRNPNFREKDEHDDV
jgi:hypothetical protein